jgi:hypothetical protein
VFNADLNGITLTIGLWQVHRHVQNHGDSFALASAYNFSK